MVRLEGLIKGGAAGNHEGCFMEHLRTLKDPLLDQMVDRCALVAAGANTLSSNGYIVGFVEGLDRAAAELSALLACIAQFTTAAGVALLLRLAVLCHVQALSSCTPGCTPVLCAGSRTRHQV
jgi:hypothetical protein